jgi:hypothetical protein
MRGSGPFPPRRSPGWRLLGLHQGRVVPGLVASGAGAADGCHECQVGVASDVLENMPFVASLIDKHVDEC